MAENARKLKAIDKMKTKYSTILLTIEVKLLPFRHI